MDGISQVDANDIDKASVEAIQANVQLNGRTAVERVKTTQVRV